MSIVESIEKNVDKVDSAQKAVLQRILDAVDSANQKFNIVEPSTQNGESINSVKARLVSALGMFRGLAADDINFTLVPFAYLNNLDGQLVKISAELEKITSAFSQIEANGGIGSINPSNQTITSQNGQFNFDFTPVFNAIDTLTDNALDSYYRIGFVIDKPDYSQIAAITDEFTEVLNDLAKKKSELSEIAKSSNDLKKKIEKASSDTESQFKSAEELVKQINTTKTQADTAVAKINEIADKGNAQSPVIEQVYQKAISLKKDIDGYEQQFNKFQTELDARLKNYTEGNTQLEQLLKSLREQEEKIKSINEEAKSALNYATVAGLAKGFGDRKDNLSSEQDTAFKSFKNSLWLFFLSSLIPLGYLAYKITTGGKIEIEELSMALLPVIPAIVFTKFAASKHNNLFKLREHYAHKFAVSFSLKGFKDEIKPENQQGIVEATFKDLAVHNPANSIDSRDGGERHPLPFWDSITSFFSPRK